MDTLRIFLFGIIHLRLERQVTGNSIDIRLPRSTQGLFSYLILGPHRTHSREALAGMLWEEYDQDRARDCLNTALWRLRRTIESGDIEHGTYILTKSNGEVGFNFDSNYWLDVEEFSSTTSRIISKSSNLIRQENVGELENTLSLYTGDLLEGVYSDWALRKREQLRLLQLDSFAYLMTIYKDKGEYARSINYGLKILDTDPLREEIHRDLMRLYQANGQRAQALSQYKYCQTILNKELGISPMDETVALYQKILDESAQQKKQPEINKQQRENLEISLKNLNHTLLSFNEIQSKLKQTIQDIYNEIGFNE